MNDTNYAMQILFSEQYTDENGETKLRLRSLVLDAVSDPRTSASSTITTHPIVSGDMVADHMYKNPMTLSFDGKAALKGHSGAAIDSSKLTPAKLQEIFNQIKDNGYRCEVFKFSSSNFDDIRFARHSNMVLTSMTITEKLNSIDYSLQWTQVLVAEVQEADVDISDAFLPNVTEPVTTSFTDALIDWESVDKALITQMISLELLENSFIKHIGSMATTALVAVAVGVGVGIFFSYGTGAAIAAAISSALSLAASSAALAGTAVGAAAGAAASGPVGWIIAAVVAAAIIAVGLISILVKTIKAKNYRVKAFKAYKDDKKTAKEVERFCAFIGEVHKQLQALNDVIHVHQISSDDDQECMVSISNSYYIFTFSKNSVDKSMTQCVIKDVNDNTVASIQDVSTCPSNFYACNTDNALFRSAETGTYVYIISPSEKKDFKLSNCYVVVSDINPEDYSKLLSDLIKNALTY